MGNILELSKYNFWKPLVVSESGSSQYSTAADPLEFSDSAVMLVDRRTIDHFTQMCEILFFFFFSSAVKDLRYKSR